MNGPPLAPFIRYAEKTDFLRSRGFFRAYDCRLLYCLEGRGALRFDDGVYPLFPGTLALYPAGIRYLPQSSQEAPMEFIVVNFDYYGDFADQPGPFEPVSSEEFQPEGCFDSWRRTGEPCFTRPLVLPNFQSVENELLALVQEWRVKQLCCREIASSLLATVLYRVLRQASLSPQGGRRTDQLLDFIHANYARKLDYAAIAQEFHYHPYYLNNLIRARTGQSLHRYIMGYRLREACRLLTSTSDSVGDIARAVGFENKDHFSACFKKGIGVSPLQYRRRHNL